MEPQIQYARRPDGARTAYATMGDGPVLLVPPGGTTHLDWYYGCTEAHERFCSRLAERRTLVLYDRHGCGLSDRNRTDFTPEDDMLDIEAVIEAVGAPQIDLFGISWGGNPTLAYAARHPERVRRMILYGTGADGPRVPPQLVEAGAAVAVLRRTNPEQYLRNEAIKYFPSGTDPETFQSLVRMLRDSTTLDMLENLEKVRFDNQSVLKQIMTPTLIVHRRGDQAAPFVFGQYMARHLPNARFIPLDGDAHYPWVDDADSVLRPTIEFLTEEDDTGGERGEADRAASPAAGATLVSKPAEKTFASGRYIVQRLLGQGAQKSVYLVDDTTLNRQCALSMLNATLLDQKDKERIKQEAQTMAQLGSQPNIVTVYDYGEEDGSPFVVCEYVPGGELRAELSSAGGPLSNERAVSLAADLCRALSFAHSRDIVHRDLKPENVWLTEDGNAKLGDFGIALTLGRTRLTMPGGVSGTALYMAPEQASGGEIDARTDLYALGVLLYELVTGSPPFVGDDPNAIMYQHVNAEPESPVEHNPSLPPSLERLILRLLAKPKSERPGSAEEVLAELERAAAA
ncbi:MAG: alpha/beta fold hydrolase [Chloroflexi bacterium]|nr:alpha/beta fold hydrolase [Chloroflexota bacterium]